ncbi:hypothetical protein C8R47DRAFT_1204257 [Mycena vitilis]|nr:hypothetical protein C8R47DRAFT_1204257 [Mycena vitilis]
MSADLESIFGNVLLLGSFHHTLTARMARTKRTKISSAPVAVNEPAMNAGVFLKIPTEIWAEIVSDSDFRVLGSVKDGMARSLLLLSRSKIKSCPKTVPTGYRERPETLRALSQTCRALRGIFLPLFWEHLEACLIPKTTATWGARVAKVLLDRCKGLMKSESLRSYVRIVSVSFSSYHIDEVVPLFAKCLLSLPNLDTLHILHLQSKFEEIVTAGFKNIELPSTRAIILPSYAHSILAACPNVRDVSCNEETGAKLLNTLVKRCPSVERIQGFKLTSSKLKDLSKALPNLREIAVPASMNISSLLVLKRLSVIELIANCEDEEGSETGSDDDGEGEERQEISTARRAQVDAARAVLKASSGTAPKRIKMSYWEDITGMLGMAEITYGQYWHKPEVPSNLAPQWAYSCFCLQTLLTAPAPI